MARTPQMNIRVPDELRARLKAAARRRGVSQSILVRHALEHVASSEPDLPGPPPSLPGAADEQDELVHWLAERTGKPRALVRLCVERGRLRVDGEDARKLERVPSDDAQMTLDGQPV